MPDDAKKNMPPKASSVKKSVLREWVDSFIIAAILALIIRSFAIQAFKIPSGSMRMTLIEGDRLIVNKLKYGPLLTLRFKSKILYQLKRLPGFSKPQRGDIIVFIFPQDPGRDFIKRLIAFGGETVEIKDGHIYINDQLVKDPAVYNITYYNRGDYGEENQKVVVPPGHVYVLGDNSLSSHDSRYWGFVTEDYIIGKAEVIYWPFSRMRVLK